MKIKDIKTIDINAKEWFDKANGNSYFSAEIILNYGLEDVKILKCPFQYGYGDHYQEMAFQEIRKTLGIKTNKVLWRFCEEKKITLRTNKEENCLKRDLIA